MTVVYHLVFGALAVAAGLVVVRLLRGPRALDRILALEVLVSLIVSGTAVGIAAREDPTGFIALVVIALLGFVGSVTAAHLIEEREGIR